MECVNPDYETKPLNVLFSKRVSSERERVSTFL